MELEEGRWAEKTRRLSCADNKHRSKYTKTQHQHIPSQTDHTPIPPSPLTPSPSHLHQPNIRLLGPLIHLPLQRLIKLHLLLLLARTRHHALRHTRHLAHGPLALEPRRRALPRRAAVLVRRGLCRRGVLERARGLWEQVS